MESEACPDRKTTVEEEQKPSDTSRRSIEFQILQKAEGREVLYVIFVFDR